MRTAKVKQEEETDKNNSKRIVRNLEEGGNVGTKGKCPERGLTSVEDASLPTIDHTS